MQIDAALWAQVSGENGALDERIKEAVSVVTTERERLTAVRTQLSTALKTVDEHIVKCNRVLKAAGVLEQPNANGSKKSSKSKSASGEAYVSREVADRIFDAIKSRADEGGTAKEIAEVTTLNPSTVRSAINSLRNDNRIRAAGKRPARHGMPPEVYKVMSDGE